MSNLVKILYDVGAIRSRYRGAHEAICGFSARKLLRSLHRRRPEHQAAELDELHRILSMLRGAMEALEALGEHDLCIRRGREIQVALADYIAALTESTTRLEALCRQLAQEEDADPDNKGDKGHELKIAYDDAVQHHKRCGTRLNDLISAL
jgi:hypothetical protein